MATLRKPPGQTSVSAEVAGNHLTLQPDGPPRLDCLIELIEGAKQSLRLLYYIFADDASGQRVRDALLAAVKRGVAVSLLVDGFGSESAKGEFFQPLLDANAHFCRFVPKYGRRYLLRNHQKLALADEAKVMIGGFNVADDYFHTIADGGWRDLGLIVEGKSVACLAKYYDSLFDWARKPHGSMRRLRRMLAQHSTNEGKMHWLFGGPTRRLSPWARAVKNDMLGAARLDMIAAYFAPSRAMVRRIRNVARHGKARVITAALSDNTTTIQAARHTYWRLLRRGTEVYEYQPTKLHSKLIIVDDAVHIGSANFDMRSLYLNLELMLRVDDADFARQMAAYVDGEVAYSKQITLREHAADRTLLNRVKWGFAYFLVAMADYNLSRRLNFGFEPSG